VELLQIDAEFCSDIYYNTKCKFILTSDHRLRNQTMTGWHN